MRLHPATRVPSASPGAKTIATTFVLAAGAPAEILVQRDRSDAGCAAIDFLRWSRCINEAFVSLLIWTELSSSAVKGAHTAAALVAQIRKTERAPRQAPDVARAMVAYKKRFRASIVGPCRTGQASGTARSVDDSAGR